MNRTEFLKRLKRARNIVARGWTQKASARTAQGRRVDWAHPKARKFCMIGALNRAGLSSTWRRFEGMLGAPVLWNDHADRKKSEVLAVFDNSIKWLEEQLRRR